MYSSINIVPGTGRSLEKEEGNASERGHVNGPMTGHGIVILEKKGTTTETGIGIGTETGKEIVGVTVIGLGRETVIGSVNVIVLARGSGIGNVTEIMTVQVMKEAMGMHMRGMLSMIILSQRMIGRCLG